MHETTQAIEILTHIKDNYSRIRRYGIATNCFQYEIIINNQCIYFYHTRGEIILWIYHESVAIHLIKIKFFTGLLARKGYKDFAKFLESLAADFELALQTESTAYFLNKIRIEALKKIMQKPSENI